jgi:hypothetical protein
MPQVGSIGQRTPLARGRDAIVSRQWSITPHGTAPAAPTLTGATTDTVAVSGMLAGCCYRLIEHVVTSSRTIGAYSSDASTPDRQCAGI